MTFSVECELPRPEPVVVFATVAYTRGHPGSRDVPPESDEYDVTAVLDEMGQAVDVTDHELELIQDEAALLLDRMQEADDGPDSEGD